MRRCIACLRRRKTDADGLCASCNPVSKETRKALLVLLRTDRDLVINRLRLLMETLPTSMIKAYADSLPVAVDEAAKDFTKLLSLGNQFRQQIVDNNVSVPYELYQVIKDRDQLSGENQTKEAVPQGTK